MFKAFANILLIPDLRRKFLITIGLLSICRIGVYIPLPGIDLARMAEIVGKASEGETSRLMVLANIFSGGAMLRAGIMALGIMPYISAAIIFQMLVAVVPALEKIAKEGESGRRRINQYTRYATVALCLVQAMLMTNYLSSEGIGLVPTGSWRFTLTAMVSMTAGTMFLMWIGEQIDEFGLGNGTSLIIMMNILSRLPVALTSLYRDFTWSLEAPNKIGPSKLLLLVSLFVFMIVAVVVITQGQRRVPMNSARRTREGFSQKSYLPLRVNMAGVISIIFAQSVMMLPGVIYENVGSLAVKHVMSYFVQWSFLYVMLYMAMIVFFSYFYTAIVFNPVEQANQFKQYGTFIPGIRPGRRTAEYLERIMNRITLAGAVFLALIAVAPQAVSSAVKIDAEVASFFGGTSLLITVGVALDLVQRIESHMMLQAYDGFMRGGRIRGRR